MFVSLDVSNFYLSADKANFSTFSTLFVCRIEIEIFDETETENADLSPQTRTTLHVLCVACIRCASHTIHRTKFQASHPRFTKSLNTPQFFFFAEKGKNQNVADGLTALGPLFPFSVANKSSRLTSTSVARLWARKTRQATPGTFETVRKKSRLTSLRGRPAQVRGIWFVK